MSGSRVRAADEGRSRSDRGAVASAAASAPLVLTRNCWLGGIVLACVVARPVWAGGTITSPSPTRNAPQPRKDSILSERLAARV